MERHTETPDLPTLRALADYMTSQTTVDMESGLYEAVGQIEGANEEDVQRIDDLRDALVRHAGHPAGRQIIGEMIGATLSNPYPYYRDHGLATLCVAALATPAATLEGESGDGWLRRQLRAILSIVLQAEGVTFTFALPAMLLALPHSPTPAAENLESLMRQGPWMQDRWGTQLRAMAADVRARLGSGQLTRHDAAARLRESLARPLGFAGFATLGLLTVANLCLELGIPYEDVPVVVDATARSLLEQATEAAANVRDPTFRTRRVLLVHRYWHEWLAREHHDELRDAALVRAQLAQMADRDSRLEYVSHLSARAVQARDGGWPALKRLLPLALSDATTLDGVLARIVALYPGEWQPAEVDAAIGACASDLATGRPWEYATAVATAHLLP
jgi:hypothetical protein